MMETRISPLVNLGISGYSKGLARARLVEGPSHGDWRGALREASPPAAGGSWPYEGLKVVFERESKGPTGQLGREWPGPWEDQAS